MSNQQKDSYAVAHFLKASGVDAKQALAVAGIVDEVALTLKSTSRHFLRSFRQNGLEELKAAWVSATGDKDGVPCAIEADDLSYMLPASALRLFSHAEERTLQVRLEAGNPRLAEMLVFEQLPSGSELRDPQGQRLMHAIRVSLGDKSPEGPLGRLYGNSFARVLCRNVKYCLYLHAAYVLRHDDAGAAATRDLAGCLPMALPLAYGDFADERVEQKTGPVFMVSKPRVTY